MRVLGINISHDASSCLYEDGEIKFYIEDERLAWEKHYQYIIPIKKKYWGLQRIIDLKIDKIDHIIFSSFRQRDIDDQLIASDIIDQIRSCSIDIGQIHFLKKEHHLYHAYNAFYNSKFEEAVALVIDGAGAYIEDNVDLNNDNKLEKVYREIESIYRFKKDGQREILYKHYSNHQFQYGVRHMEVTYEPHEVVKSNIVSCGRMFSAASKKVGLNEGYGAGTFMAMAPYAKDVTPIEWVKDGILTEQAQISLNPDIKISLWEDKTKLAHRVQEATKEITIHRIQKAIDKSGCKNIVMSGGYFLNCVNNYEYLKAFPDVNFYIDPMAHDGGTSLGAVYFLCEALKLPINPIKDLYLGI